MQSQSSSSRLATIQAVITNKYLQTKRALFIANTSYINDEGQAKWQTTFLNNLAIGTYELSNAKTAGALWRFLLMNFNNEFTEEILEELFKKNIQPTYDELSECDEYNQNCWFLIISQHSATWLAVLDKFVEEYKIIPQSADLNKISKLTNTSSWHGLSRYNEHKHWFYAFITEFNCIPSTEAMNAIFKKNNTSPWFRLFWGTDHCDDIPPILFKNNVYPSYEALSSRHSKSNKSGWYRLARILTDDGEQYLNQIMKNRILPKKEDLSQRVKFRKSDKYIHDIWCILLGGENFIHSSDRKSRDDYLENGKILVPEKQAAILEILLENNIFPSYAHYTNFIAPKIQEVDVDSPILKKLKNRVECSNILEERYRVKNELFVDVFSRHDVSDFYGFYYLFCLMTARNNPEIQLPMDIWLVILGNFPQISSADFHSPKERHEFVKMYHATNSGNVFFLPPFKAKEACSPMIEEMNGNQSDDVVEPPLKRRKLY